ncbi:sigma-70 family RNA polymerase sigma factor [Arsenicicoccus piscis]|uniref:RNA polymerase sigma factor n=1 Tax=Arsenicicoccus piscis TaxID=673954 RepID=A0ABQ6HQH4_9MICO|nr:sigma-70 family RNA polymerase sigma factor [Arsenicicoccus piscis]MCH8629126.1 sigma-70 family RNA polymerase sigma factor [Arsenicicoccus piscis]GMA20313.1 RNA polymerase sigma factor [Arsenicicoccus piscis]
MQAETQPGDPRQVVHAAWRADSARLVGALTRLTGDLALAEDLVQDALVAALEQWPTTGVPDNPAGWLMTTAKRRAVDHFRRANTLRRKVAELQHAEGEEAAVTDLDSLGEHIEDDVLRLIFLCCHPSLSPDSRAALTLRLVGGLTTAEIARGFLVAESAVGQRISRAKKTLAQVRAEFELPAAAERVARLDDVMAVIYLIFNEGYTATAGDDWMRPDLATEGIRLARMLAELSPDEPEVLGLQALLELQGSRSAARVDETGEPVLLEAQDRSRWDHDLIGRGLAALREAERLAARGRPVGRYVLQASIAAQHARARSADATDWVRIAGLYDILARAAPGPVVEVNRAVAHGRAFGPEAGLAVVDALDPDALGGSPLLPSVRGDLLERAGRHGAASAAFTDAAARTRNAGERAILAGRAADNLRQVHGR